MTEKNSNMNGESSKESHDPLMIENKKEGKSLFYNIWGWSYIKVALIFILLVFLAMVSLKMCDSPYVVQEGPGQIKIID